MLRGPAADRLTRTFQESVTRIGDRAAVIARQRWLALAAYDAAQVATFEAQTAAAMAAAKQAAVSTGVGYYSTLAQVRAPSVAVREVATTPASRDPFLAYWHALEQGRPWEEAVEAGASRAEAMARNHATSSARQAGDVTMRKARLQVDGWGRVAESGACDWCQGLESFVWDTAREADFGHDRCNCSVEPVIRAASVSVS